MMPLGSGRKQVSSFRPRQRWDPTPLSLNMSMNKKINASAILKALDRQIRQLERKERSRTNTQRSRTELTARKTFSAPIKQSPQRKPVTKARKHQLKGILRKTSLQDNFYGPSSDGEDTCYRNSSFAPRKGFSLSEIEPTLGGAYRHPEFGMIPFQRSPQKVRFETELKHNSKSQQKSKTIDYTCHNDNLFFSDHPRSYLNIPEHNLSSNKPMSQEWLDLKSRWGDFSHRNSSLRRSNKSSLSHNIRNTSDDSIGDYKFCGEQYNPDLLSYSSDVSEIGTPNKYNHDLISLDGKPRSHSDMKKPSDVYYNPNFEKLEKLITTPLNNIDILLEKYRTNSDVPPKPTSTDWKFSLRNLIGSSHSAEPSEKKSVFQREEKPSRASNDALGANSTLDKSFYLSTPFINPGQFSKGIASRSSLISISSSESYGNFHNDKHQSNYSENNLTSDVNGPMGSPIRQTELPASSMCHQDEEEGSPFKQPSPTKGQDPPESPRYLDPQCEVNDFTENHHLVSNSYDGENLGSPTIQSSKLSLDLDAANESLRVCEKADGDTCFDECQSPPCGGKQPASSAGDSSPIVFESSSTSYEDLLQKYKTSSNTKCHSWMPQSKVLQDILQDEYDGPWSRKKRFENEDNEIPNTKHNFSERSEKSELGSVKELISQVNGSLLEASTGEVQSKQQDNCFDLTELKRRMSRLAMERF